MSVDAATSAMIRFSARRQGVPRARRIDFQGAFQWVQIRGSQAARILFDPRQLSQVVSVPGDPASRLPHARAFLSSLGQQIDECGTELIGYCLEPAAAGLLLRTQGVPVQRFMQRLGGAYSNYWRHRSERPEGTDAQQAVPFGTRYRSKIIAPEYVPYALRRLHRRSAGMPVRLLPELLSSEQAYLGGRAWLTLTTSIVYALLEKRGLPGPKGYRQFMSQPESPHIALLFEQGAPQDAGIVGGRAFVVHAHDAMRHPRAAPDSRELIEAVARQLNVAPAALSSATRVGMLGRSMVAWYGLRTGRSLTEIGRWFSVSAATLGRGMRHHRELSPEHFLPHLPGLDDESGTGSDP